MPKINPDGSQEDRVLKVLIEANGEWVNGQYFLQNLYLSQYHRAIWNLEHVRHIKIEHSELKDEWGFKSYRILPSIPEPIAIPAKVEEESPRYALPQESLL